MDAKTISLRVTAQEAAAIQRLAKALGVTQSDVLKQGIVALQNQLQEQRSSYELGEDVFGRHGSGRTGTSVRRRTMYKEAVRAKRIVDSGPLIAFFDRDDAYHGSVKAFMKATPLKLTTTWPVLTEVCALVPRLAAFDFMDFACRGGVDVEDVDVSDLSSIVALSRKYVDLPMDFADASLVVLAIKRNVDVIVSLDRDFDVYRLAHKKSFRNLFSSLRRS